MFDHPIEKITYPTKRAALSALAGIGYAHVVNDQGQCGDGRPGTRVYVAKVDPKNDYMYDATVSKVCREWRVAIFK